MTIAKQSNTIPVPAGLMPLFRQQASGVQTQLQDAATITLTRAE